MPFATTVLLTTSSAGAEVVSDLGSQGRLITLEGEQVRGLLPPAPEIKEAVNQVRSCFARVLSGVMPMGAPGAERTLFTGALLEVFGQGVEGQNFDVVVVPSWLSDSPYFKTSVTAGLFCDNAFGALVPPLLVALVRPPVVRSGPPAGHLWGTPRT
jgi:hypothetical protein